MQKLFVVAGIFILTVTLYSQEIPKYSKGFYTDSVGRLYVQKELPIYLWISNSKSPQSNKHRLTSEQSALYSNPLYLDTEGYNTIRTPSAIDTITRQLIYPKQDIVFEVYADGTAPVTHIDFGKTELNKSNGTVQLGKETLISLKATDKISGTENIYFSINGEAFKPYVSTIQFTEEKAYQLKFYAVDNVGNVEKLQVYNLIYDKSAPISKLEIEGDSFQNILSGRTKLILKTEDQGAGSAKINYSLDNLPEKTYTAPLLTAYFSQDEHTLTYYSIDKVGNRETEHTFTFYIDKTPPTIIEEVMGKSFFANGKEFSSGKSRLKLTSFDNKSGVNEVKYSVNDGEYQLYDKPVFLNQVSGNMKIQSYATDKVNNKSVSQMASDKTAIPYIDLSGPELSYSFTGPVFKTRDTVFINPTTKLLLRGTDAEAGLNHIDYSINGSDPILFDKGFSLPIEGFTTIDYTGFDNVENTSTKSFGVKVDNTGPEIGFQFGSPSLARKDGLMVYPKHTVIFITAIDKVVGFQKMTYTLNNSVPADYKGLIQNLPTGKNSIKVIAYDQLGNSTEKTLEIMVE